jgi:UPF0755 protein
MFKKIMLTLLLIIVAAAAFIGWRFFMPNTPFKEESRYLYIRSDDANREAVMRSLIDSNLIRNPRSFELLANKTRVWTRLQPGRYRIRQGTNLFALVRMLRNGSQSPVNLVITKLRTKEQFAELVGRKFESDSAAFMNFLSNPDTLSKYGIDTNTVMTTIYPDTYTYLWTATPSEIYKKLYAVNNRVWTTERKELAKQQGLTPAMAYILASIIEEETNDAEDKPLMASVYLNRLRTGMKLGADPTLKFALRDFELKRIYNKHKEVESPYNTYRYAGLPPGPICTPSLQTLDAVLNAPQTKYLYFVAKSDFSQKHVFTETYEEHMKYAREYQKALNEYEAKKQQSPVKDSLVVK